MQSEKWSKFFIWSWICVACDNSIAVAVPYWFPMSFREIKGKVSDILGSLSRLSSRRCFQESLKVFFYKVILHCMKLKTSVNHHSIPVGGWVVQEISSGGREWRELLFQFTHYTRHFCLKAHLHPFS